VVLKNLLPTWLYIAISKECPEEYIQELRVRLNRPLQGNFKGRIFKFCLADGLKTSPYIASEDLISYIISVATKQSLYAYAEQIKKGFISTDNGVRIGLCGTAVYENETLTMLKKITSLNIRFGHFIHGCSGEIVRFLVEDDRIKNTLIISPPGAGKTTLLRDLIFRFSEECNASNILVVDERFELAGFSQEFMLGKNVDVVSGVSKKFAFSESLKVMNPSVIVADEIADEGDIEAIKQASKSGVQVVATAHAENLEDLKSKKYFREIFEEGYFERFVILSKRNGVGTIEGVFSARGKPLYIPYEL
jgi:stage III sporulation protein AA